LQVGEKSRSNIARMEFIAIRVPGFRFTSSRLYDSGRNPAACHFAAKSRNFS
jgi:hypothetical protein